MANSALVEAVVVSAETTVAQAPRMPLAFVLRAEAVAVKKGLAPTSPEPDMKVSVAPVERLKVPARAIVPEPEAPEPRITLEPPARLMFPSVAVVAVPLRDKKSKAPPSIWKATALLIRAAKDWMPVSSQRRTPPWR